MAKKSVSLSVGLGEKLPVSQGAKEKMRKPGAEGAPTAKDFKESAKTAKDKK